MAKRIRLLVAGRPNGKFVKRLRDAPQLASFDVIEPADITEPAMIAAAGEAEAIINAIAPEVVSELEQGKPKKFKRKKKRKK